MKRGFTGLEVMAAVAVLGLVAWIVKPSLFPGASKRAKTSTETTQKLEETTTKKDASAAASVATMLSAASTLPETPVKSFLSQEGGVAMSLLPPPDAHALIAAEQRKNAVLSGRLEEASRLYEKALQNAEKLQAERNEALAARRAADDALVVAAAAEHARTVQMLGVGTIALIVGGAWLYLRVTGISPTTLGTALADIGKGADPTVTFDGLLSVAQQKRVNRARRLAP